MEIILSASTLFWIIVISIAVGVLAMIALSFMLSKKEMSIDQNVWSSARRLFHYSFDEINWEYDKLTTKEKVLVTKKDFEELKKEFY